MKFLNIGILSWIILLPFIASIAILFINKTSSKIIQWIAISSIAIQFILVLIITLNFNQQSGINPGDTLQFIEQWRWIDAPLSNNNRFIVEYFLAVDGLSLPLLILTSLISLISLFVIKDTIKNQSAFYSLLLVLNSALIGIFVSLDFLLFFIFLQFTVLIIYFLINIWSEHPRGSHIALKFAIYQMTGNALIFFALILFYVSSSDVLTGNHTFNLIGLTNTKNIQNSSILYGNITTARLLTFVCLFIGFAVKLPIFPFHLWFKNIISSVPVSLGITLSTLFVSTGAYGFLRIVLPLMPDASVYFAYAISILAVISIIYFSICTLAESDLRKITAYASVTQMSFIMLGISSLTSQGLSGSVILLFIHGITTALMIILISFIHHRTGSYNIDNFAGLAKNKTKLLIAVITIIPAMIYFPLTGNFIGITMIYLGALSIPSLQIQVLVSIIGFIFIAVCFIKILQIFIENKKDSVINSIQDLSLKEIAIVLPLIIIIIATGIFPSLITNLSSGSVTQLTDFISRNYNSIMTGW